MTHGLADSDAVIAAASASEAEGYSVVMFKCEPLVLHVSCRDLAAGRKLLGLALDAWVIEEVDETVVITGGEELLVSRAADGVDVGAIGALGVDTGGLPEELAGDGSPDSVLEV